MYRVYVMGGALRVPGNVSPLAEFNFANDASAASSVIVAFSKKITVFPLDATMQCLLSKNDLEALSRISGVVGHWFAKSVAPFYMQAYRSHNGVDMPLHDAHTVGALIQPDLYAGQ
jgi:purine nucleosidase